MNLCITGAAGYIGGRILEQVDKDPDIKKVLSIDRALPKVASSKLTAVTRDINDPLDDLFGSNAIDAVIHLVFLVNPIHDTDLMYRINVTGTENVLRTCHKKGVKRILVVSSSTAYGAHADNLPFMEEDAPLRGNESYQYARDKVLVERLCESYQREHPEAEIVMARPCIVMGPHVGNFISRFMTRKFVFLLNDADPAMQFVHEDDVARMIYLLIKKGRRGAYNIAPDDVLSMSEIVRLFQRRPIKLPSWLMYPLTDCLWKCHLHALTETSSGLIDFIRYPWVVSSEKLKKELGVDFQYTTREALLALVETMPK